MLSIKYFLKLILYKPLFNALIFLVWLIPGNNVGWAIIILTIITRLILLPPSIKATRQQKRMKDLQPEIQKIQSQYKDDKQKQSQAVMAFYRENKINPLGSCLPLLIQLPILIILYYVFINGLSTERFDLLYDFTPRPETLQTFFLGIDLAKNDRYILPVIAGILQYFQARQLTPPSPPRGQEKGQEIQAMLSKQMLYLMPIFTVIVAGQLPAALPLYWAVTTLFAIGQQWWVLRDSANSKLKGQNSKLEIPKEPAMIKKGGVEVTVRKKK
ncbi:MAG TPA: YidC/Oxa1 family membrane protein insertase [Patescibacteria group bacterium]|nr:YidC/Oxa1 family membrane protein insertase [Patescibacteria group bacterium]